jgi:hypothetical protein
MAGRAGEHDLVAEERLEANAPPSPRGADDAELELPLGHAVDDGLRVVHLERDAHGGVASLELAEELRHDDRRGPGRGAERELSAERSLGPGGDLLDEVLLERKQPLRAAVEPLAGLRRLDTPPRAVE